MKLFNLRLTAHKVGAVVRGTLGLSSAELQQQRTEICRACPKFDPALGGSCSICRCPIVSTTLTRAHCPDNPPRW